jgi:hypothetical protein
MFLRYGYADNKPNDDAEANSFDFDWAVDAQRQPVSLDFVDFVRVYTGVNQFCGWMAETSTEIAHVEDLHLDASLQAIREATGIRGIYDLPNDDAPVYKLNSRIYIKNGKKYFFK